MNKNEEMLPKEISKLSEFYTLLSRKKEGEGDITGAVTELLRAQEEDSGENREFYMSELDRLKGMLSEEDEQLKAELIELYRQKALKTETADLYVNADKYAEELMKQLLQHNTNAVEQLKDMAEEYDIHTDKISEYIGNGIVKDDASVAGKAYDAEYVETNARKSSDYDDIKRLITLISDEETTDIELATGEYLPGYGLFLSYFPERFSQRFEEDFRTGNLSDITDTIIQSLEKGDEDSGAFMISLYTLFFEYSDIDENPWCEERAYYYLAKAHETGAINDRTYARILKNLAKAEKQLARIKKQAEKKAAHKTAQSQKKEPKPDIRQKSSKEASDSGSTEKTDPGIDAYRVGGTERMEMPKKGETKDPRAFLRYFLAASAAHYIEGLFDNKAIFEEEYHSNIEYLSMTLSFETTEMVLDITCHMTGYGRWRKSSPQTQYKQLRESYNWLAEQFGEGKASDPQIKILSWEGDAMYRMAMTCLADERPKLCLTGKVFYEK